MPIVLINECITFITMQFTHFFYKSSIATYDVQSIDVTSTSGEVCVVCRFSINTTAVGCEIQLRNNIVTLSRRFNRDVNNIAEGCISNIITGYYHLYVYDVENDNTLSQLPAIIKNQVFVDEQTTTIVTTTGSIATTGSIITTSTITTASTTTTARLTTVLASSSISLILSSSISSTS